MLSIPSVKCSQNSTESTRNLILIIYSDSSDENGPRTLHFKAYGQSILRSHQSRESDGSEVAVTNTSCGGHRRLWVPCDGRLSEIRENHCFSSQNRHENVELKAKVKGTLHNVMLFKRGCMAILTRNQ